MRSSKGSSASWDKGLGFLMGQKLAMRSLLCMDKGVLTGFLATPLPVIVVQADPAA